MGYFNYFIKCIIRKFVNILFKPKMFLALLIIIGVLFAMQITSRAEWTDDQITDLQADLFDIIFQLTQQVNSLKEIKDNSYATNNRLDWINGNLSNINDNVSSLTGSVEDMALDIENIRTQLVSLNSEILNIYNALEENQKELLQELEKDNESIVNVLQDIKNILQGNETVETITPIMLNGLSITPDGFVTSDETGFIYYFPYDKNSKYNIEVINNNSVTSYGFSVCGSNSIPVADNKYSVIYRTSISSNSSYTYQLSSGYNYNYIIIRPYLNHSIFNIQKVSGNVGFSGVQDSINQGNQLQQESNQLQQEQNDFLKQEATDDDISVDSFNNVDSNDITSNGLNGVFNSIYNSITSWNAKNISLPIPYTNKSIVIPANYTESMLNSSGGGWIITFIHAVYYFIVGRFMIYSITNIVNSIKSGSILNTDSKNNITTDML